MPVDACYAGGIGEFVRQVELDWPFHLFVILFRACHYTERHTKAYTEAANARLSQKGFCLKEGAGPCPKEVAGRLQSR